MTKAVVFASLGVNAGDDLMNISLTNYLVASGYKVSCMSANVLQSSSINKYATRVFSDRISSLPIQVWEIIKSKVVVVGGGTLVQSDFKGGGVSPILARAAFYTAIARILRKRVAVVGLGVNSVAGANKLLATLLVLSAGRIVYRDEESYECMKGNIPRSLFLRARAKMVVAEDLAFLEYAQDEVDRKVGRESFCGSKKLYLSVVGENHVGKSISVVRQAVSTVIEGGVDNLILVAMDRRESEELSIYRQVLNEVLVKFPSISDRIEVRSVNNPLALLYEIASCSNAASCGMRLHFLIISMIAGVPPFVLSRESKTDNLARRYDLPLISIDEIDSSAAVNWPEVLAGVSEAKKKLTNERVESAYVGLIEELKFCFN